MKQFENWIGPDKCPVETDCRVPCSEEFDCIDCLKLLHTGWKAALKWALSHKKPISYNNYKFDYIKTDVIEEELKETE